MAEPKTKKTFGSCDLNRISPIPREGLPKVMNIVISFEDALRLHLSLGQALAKLNTYNRSTKAGKQSAVNLGIHTEKGRLTVNEGKIQK